MKSFRKKAGISQMKLAERCDTSPSYIGEIEIGRKFPSIEMIEKIASALGIEAHQLFMDPGPGEPYPRLPKGMSDEILAQIHQAVSAILKRY
ncbi:MAG: helix-turn-helix transcriptional regulator [Spirochaetales bacterium]|nr:helix-turn-helix transcriptional regulator [Spirochaetales bacterium]